MALLSAGLATACDGTADWLGTVPVVLAARCFAAAGLLSAGCFCGPLRMQPDEAPAPMLPAAAAAGAAVGLALWLALERCTSPLVSKLLMDTVPPASRALWSGAESGLWLGWCLATGAGGALTDAAGFQAAFLSSAALLLLGAAAQLPLLRLTPGHGRRTAW